VALAYARSKSGSRLDLAQQMGVQLSTIDSHIKEVFTKLNVHGRLELAEMIWKYGWK
jgi:DNA-binding NarL/FixJ family response regulator